MNLRIFSVYETESAGARPSFLWVLFWTMAASTLNYAGNWLYLAFVVASPLAQETAAAKALAFGSALMGVLSVCWTGLHVAHSGATAAPAAPPDSDRPYWRGRLDSPGVLEMAKNDRREYNFETSEPQSAIWLHMGQTSVPVPDITDDQLTVLYQRIKVKRDVSIPISLRTLENEAGEKIFGDAGIKSLRAYLIKHQLAVLTRTDRVVLRPEAARAFEGAYNTMVRNRR